MVQPGGLTGEFHSAGWSRPPGSNPERALAPPERSRALPENAAGSIDGQNFDSPIRHLGDEPLKLLGGDKARVDDLEQGIAEDVLPGVKTGGFGIAERCAGATSALRRRSW